MIEWFTIGVTVVAQVFAAGVVYGAIRADLRNLHDRVESVEKRIDKLILRGKNA